MVSGARHHGRGGKERRRAIENERRRKTRKRRRLFFFGVCGSFGEASSTARGGFSARSGRLVNFVSFTTRPG